ncbi:MAG: ComF family protein [Bacteroidales bacterium]|nr:ComF family protein [Bacteroidales bacterium]
MLATLNDFVSLFYPQVCCACGNSLYRNEEIICSFCRFHLPKTNFHKNVENPLSKTFWGRVKLENVGAYFYFSKGGKVQHLMHQFKYRGQYEIGVYLGRLYGSELKQEDAFRDIEMVIPVPLHPDKLRKRGYNQSEKIAEGLAKSMEIAMESGILIRTYASATQTRKSRFSRWENVKEIFEITHPEKIAGKHLLLVDDVITTGATIEACATHLLGVEGTRVSVVSLACAMH